MVATVYQINAAEAADINMIVTVSIKLAPGILPFQRRREESDKFDILRTDWPYETNTQGPFIATQIFVAGVY
jgi:hypothetical protein